VDSLTCDPFCEKPVPWWRSLFRSGKGHAPKRYARFVGFFGPLSGFILQSGDGLSKPERLAIFAGLSLIPPYVVERWWRARERRQDERLLVLPE
jgi:hypothetical protein